MLYAPVCQIDKIGPVQNTAKKGQGSSSTKAIFTPTIAPEKRSKKKTPLIEKMCVPILKKEALKDQKSLVTGLKQPCYILGWTKKADLALPQHKG